MKIIQRNLKSIYFFSEVTKGNVSHSTALQSTISGCRIKLIWNLIKILQLGCVSNQVLECIYVPNWIESIFRCTHRDSCWAIRRNMTRIEFLLIFTQDILKCSARSPRLPTWETDFQLIGNQIVATAVQLVWSACVCECGFRHLIIETGLWSMNAKYFTFKVFRMKREKAINTYWRCTSAACTFYSIIVLWKQRQIQFMRVPFVIKC